MQKKNIFDLFYPSKWFKRLFYRDSEEVKQLQKNLQNMQKEVEKLIEFIQKNAKEILAQNEELQRLREELLQQQAFIDMQKRNFEKKTSQLLENEKILIKSHAKLKQSEAEIKQQKVELEAMHKEILTQNRELLETQQYIEIQQTELEKSNKKMKDNEKILVKAFEKIKAAEAEIRLKKDELESKNAEITAQNEELHQTQEELMAQREFIEKQNIELQAQNSKIKNSIQSAYLIQQAILPYKEKMDELLKDYFIIYRPKDIVSGDFWWLNEVNGKIFLATVDCTGHGVAGAFMTMIGNTLLDKIIRLRKIQDPASILEILHEEIQIVLRQKQTRNNNGMDMSVLSWEKINEDSVKIIFSGAKHGLYYINSDTKEFQEIKGARKAIGGEQNEEKTYINHVFELPIDSWLYTGTDGLVDQNNVYRKRFGDNLLKELLVDNYHLSSENQKKLIEKAIDNHSQGTEQRDDILFWGVRIS